MSPPHATVPPLVHTHLGILTSPMLIPHWQSEAAFPCPGLGSVHHWIHFRNVLILFPDRGSFLIPFPPLYNVPRPSIA